jgi:peptidoglycan/xylan/chitin deacetylase (PgdA/CDA1 family)
MTCEHALTILLYHGVTDTVGPGIQNYSGKHIPAHQFAAQMRHLRDSCVVLSIDQVVALHQRGDPFPERAAVVSFDDGFENNYTVAAPILEEFGIPAVFYISSGIVNTDLMFWVDQIEDCINLTGKTKIEIALDRSLELPVGTAPEKIEAVEVVKRYCKRSRPAEKELVIAELVGATGVLPAVDHAPDYRKITWAQLRELARCSLFTIGGHSLYHDILSELSPEKMRDDVRLSIDILRYRLERPVVHYSYPEGQVHHFNEDVIACLRANGIVCSPSAIDGINPRGTDLFRLRRSMVGFMGTPFPESLI